LFFRLLKTFSFISKKAELSALSFSHYRFVFSLSLPLNSLISFSVVKLAFS